MKVICINTSFIQICVPNETVDKNILPPIKECDILHVVDETEYKGFHFYRFAEYVDSTGKYQWWYDARSFIPLSDKEETVEALHNLKEA